LIYNFISEINLLQFKLEYFVQFKMLPLIKKRNIFLSILIVFLSFLMLLISIVLTLFVMALYLALYLLISVPIVMLLLMFFYLSGTIDQESWKNVITIVVAGVSFLTAIINYLLNSKKSFSDNKRNIYVSLIKFLFKSIDTFKAGEKIYDIPNLSEIFLYSSKIVLKLLSCIKKESAFLKNENKKRTIIYDTMFLIDYMRNEIRNGRNEIAFLYYDFSDLSVLCNGELDITNSEHSEINGKDKIELNNADFDKTTLTIGNTDIIQKKNTKKR